MTTFDAAPYLREIARGKHSGRDLTREQAKTLFTAVFADEVAAVALGAILVALRVKGESVDELAGMMDALAPHVRPVSLPARRASVVMLPSYNGARKLPNLVPLLALLIAREGIPVLLHGAAQEPHRVATFEILSLLGYPPAASLGEAEKSLAATHLAVLPVSVLSPALGRLIDVRMQVGVRNSGHTLAKMLLPGSVEPAQACRLVSVTHPDFQQLLRDYFAIAPGNVFLMRGVEGEAVVRLHAPQPIEFIGLDGRCESLTIDGGERALSLPQRDAHATAQWTAAVLEGREPVPLALARQVVLIVGQCRKAGAEAVPSLRLVK